MDLSLNDKVILVTGSSQGIGLSIAQTLAAEGAHVIISGRRETALQAAMKSLTAECSYCVADVTDPAQCQTLCDFVIERYGRLDGLVCNVGSGKSVPPGTEMHTDWQEMLQKNFFAATNVIDQCRQALAKAQGSIVIIGSICGCDALPGAPVTYSVAKAALHHMVKGLAKPLGKQGVRINAIAPGNILFDGSVWAKKMQEDDQAVTQMLQREVALARLGKPEEIADFVAFLLSERASFSTGAIHVVDGGQLR